MKELKEFYEKDNYKIVGRILKLIEIVINDS